MRLSEIAKIVCAITYAFAMLAAIIMAFAHLEESPPVAIFYMLVAILNFLFLADLK